MMQIAETWSISYERIAAFFSGQGDVRAKGDDRYIFGQSATFIKPLPARHLGRSSFPQTRVEFDRRDEDTETIYRRFVLQFISAGG